VTAIQKGDGKELLKLEKATLSVKDKHVKLEEKEKSEREKYRSKVEAEKKKAADRMEKLLRKEEDSKKKEEVGRCQVNSLHRYWHRWHAFEFLLGLYILTLVSVGAQEAIRKKEKKEEEQRSREERETKRSEEAAEKAARAAEKAAEKVAEKEKEKDADFEAKPKVRLVLPRCHPDSAQLSLFFFPLWLILTGFPFPLFFNRPPRRRRRFLRRVQARPPSCQTFSPRRAQARPRASSPILPLAPRLQSRLPRNHPQTPPSLTQTSVGGKTPRTLQSQAFPTDLERMTGRRQTFQRRRLKDGFQSGRACQHARQLPAPHATMGPCIPS
jgi:hypothetical protein